MLAFPVRRRALAAALILPILLFSAGSPRAQDRPQDGPIQPGEAYVTRFSGARGTAIDVNGMVGSIVDLRSPGRPPQGQHWIDEPQRRALTAGEVGQVFGVALDDANPPNIYVAATSAFGLHRTPNNAEWMAGMWGDGGPGAIYRLDAATGAPRPFAQITLSGRPNSGAALGNIAYDRFNKQLFVSDLETGMIHRLRITDGADLGFYDHGTQGRPQFTDAEVNQPGSLPPIAFNPNTSSQIGTCPSRFDRSPQCWNFAASGRRIWGLGVYRNPARNEVRLYYSVWSSPAFDPAAWNQQQEEDKRNSVWSVRLGPDGGFAGDVRRELIVPDFFANPQDVARAGYSQPVSDITFAACGPRPVMLLAERGGIRNLGLNAPNPFATPHEARALRYEMDRDGAWRAIGRYDVGFYDRKNEGEPFTYANCSGGITFAPGYDPSRWVADPGKPDQFVWITGDSLCSPDGPCNLPGGGPSAQGQPPGPGPSGPGAQQAAQTQESPLDESEVHGLQGMAETAFEEVVPASANEAPSQENASSSQGLNQSYLIDIDINVDAQGAVIEPELTRNDATKIGDVAVYQICETPAPASYAQYLLPPAVGVAAVGYHYRLGSHNRELSHFRYGSHNPFWSHNRRESHYRLASHWRWASHDRRLSHRRLGSHERVRSHWRVGSHDRRVSHLRVGSHDLRASHLRSGSHDLRASHLRTGSHDLRASHLRTGSHDTRVSVSQKHDLRVSATQKHNTRISRTQQHNTQVSASQQHNTQVSAAQTHNRRVSQTQKGSGAGQKKQHNTRASQGAGQHSTAASRAATTQKRTQQPTIRQVPKNQQFVPSGRRTFGTQQPPLR